MRRDPLSRFSTYSIVARDGVTGQLGVAVQTHQMCVGVAVPWLEAGLGAIATQAMTNVRFGPMGLALLAQGLPAEKVIQALIASDDGAQNRQLAIVDREGRSAAWTGKSCIPIADHLLGDGYSVQANMMLHPGVVKAMADAYTSSGEDFPGRLLDALKAAQACGGDIRGMQSAALKIVQADAVDTEGFKQVMPVYDLRVDEHVEPLVELERLVLLRRAVLISREGHEALDAGNLEQALQLWQRARLLAPDMEELAFWQAASLADDHQEYFKAAMILKPVLAKQSNKADWIDLLQRIQQCGILEVEGTAERLIAALEDQASPAASSLS